MPRKPRLVVEGEAAVYHVMSRTALDGFVLGDAEKDHLLQLIQHYSAIYFAEVLSFCIMGNHFHLVVRMHPGEGFSDTEIRRRYSIYYQEDDRRDEPLPGQIAMFRHKWEQLSEFMKEIKQTFSRYYNKRHNRRGFFWSDRFKSVLVEDGETLINCLAYVDLNPIRAGLVNRPDDYRWNSLGYHHQTGNKGNFLSLDFGLIGAERLASAQRLAKYRQFVYEVGEIKTDKGKSIDPQIVASEATNQFSSTRSNRFLSRTRHFTDSGIIGSREFVRTLWQALRSEDDNPDKQPVRISGLEGMFSLRRLSEADRRV
ncbi:MAG: transposase [Desulfuromusa sp.]|nr:transposase [Desulfuromusa sp.]